MNWETLDASLVELQVLPWAHGHGDEECTLGFRFIQAVQCLRFCLHHVHHPHLGGADAQEANRWLKDRMVDGA